MSDSIKKQAIARILDNLKPLEAAGTVRGVSRGRMGLLTAQYPWLHVVIGDDAPAETPEDTRGYTMEFDVAIDICVTDYLDRAGKLDDLIAQVQTLVEADITLNNLVSWMKPIGENLYEPKEVTTPVGVMSLIYRVQYRRERGAPQTGY